ncbi:MAG: Fe-S-containing hydro-lyase [Treponema sp.]|jgi:fumarate hydratase subunit beta|nr:Fe-S-containing hydro-lyase [Treponema sp.]
MKINLPLSREEAALLNAGATISLNGVMYTARDAAHKRLIELLDAGKPLPFDIEGAAIYYAGPTPAPPGAIIGSAGPTTSSRMDTYTPRLLELGLRVMIGKGKRSDAVIAAIKQNGALYLGAIGGAGALLASCITAAETIAFDELGAEAIRRLVVEDFPAVVLVDTWGTNFYETGRTAYLTH